MQLCGVRAVLPRCNLRLFHQRRWCNWHRHVHHEEAFSLALWKSSFLSNGADPGRLSPLRLVASSTTGLRWWHLQALKYSYGLSSLYLLPYSLRSSDGKGLRLTSFLMVSGNKGFYWEVFPLCAQANLFTWTWIMTLVSNDWFNRLFQQSLIIS